MKILKTALSQSRSHDYGNGIVYRDVLVTQGGVAKMVNQEFRVKRSGDTTRVVAGVKIPRVYAYCPNVLANLYEVNHTDYQDAAVNFTWEPADRKSTRLNSSHSRHDALPICWSQDTPCLRLLPKCLGKPL